MDAPDHGSTHRDRPAFLPRPQIAGAPKTTLLVKNMIYLAPGMSAYLIAVRPNQLGLSETQRRLWRNCQFSQPQATLSATDGIMTRADASSITYRRWLNEKGNTLARPQKLHDRRHVEERIFISATSTMG